MDAEIKALKTELDATKATLAALLGHLGLDTPTLLMEAARRLAAAQAKQVERDAIRAEIAADQAENERLYKEALGIKPDFALSKNWRNEAGVR